MFLPAQPPPNLAPYALKAEVPTGAIDAPPPVSVASGKGALAMQYAMADHTHASKVRVVRVVSDAAGLVDWTFSPPFPAGTVPRIAAQAEVAAGTTDVVNVQIEGTPTNTGCKLRVTRTARSTVALISLTILSVPASVGAIVVHAAAIEQ